MNVGDKGVIRYLPKMIAGLWSMFEMNLNYVLKKVFFVVRLDLNQPDKKN